MKGQTSKSRLIERMIYLVHLLEKKGIEIDRAAADSSLAEQFSPEDAGRFQEIYDLMEFMDEIPGGFLIYEASEGERIIYANQNLIRMLQCKTMREFREFTGNSFRGLVCAEDLDLAEESIKRQIHEGQQDQDYVEYRIRRKDGTTRWVEDYGHFVSGEAIGDIFYVFIGNSTDERSQQQMEQKRLLSEALEKANLAVKAKNTFLSHISHDMRTPLNAIFGFTSLAKINLGDTETVREYLDEVEAAGHQLLDMITKVLDVSALISAAGPSEAECDLCRTMREVYDFLLPQAREKSISFSMDYDKVIHSGIYADQEKLKQLILNLANNAITYTGPGGSVSVTLTEKEELLDSYAVYCLEVKDNGIGIGEEFLEDIFEPFSREKNSTLSGVHGIGLGLTIAKNIVDMMHGTIEVKSSVNEGSTFIVTLTFRVQPQADVSDKNKVLAPDLHILLVEDNEINREIETELLERMGFIVDSAEDGKIALEKIGNAAPGDYDLIIMDLQMPVMDGWEASAAIRKLPDPTLAHIPIIALSANTMICDQRRALDSGIDVYLFKPMDFTVLLETIEKITDWHRN